MWRDRRAYIKRARANVTISILYIKKKVQSVGAKMQAGNEATPMKKSWRRARVLSSDAAVSLGGNATWWTCCECRAPSGVERATWPIASATWAASAAPTSAAACTTAPALSTSAPLRRSTGCSTGASPPSCTAPATKGERLTTTHSYYSTLLDRSTRVSWLVVLVSKSISLCLWRFYSII